MHEQLEFGLDEASPNTFEDASQQSMPAGYDVAVTRSKRRKKTSEARLRGNTIEIRIPAALTVTEEQELVEHFSRSFERAETSRQVDLPARAAELALAYALPTPVSIRWVSNQRHRWGSCTPSESSIRLSDRLAAFPGWVVDYVIVHELAHLVVFEHNTEFWDICNRYPLTERSRGFLIAMDATG